MRSSSVKSFVATLSMFVFVLAAAAVAQARPTTRASKPTVTARVGENPADKIARVIQRIYDRFRSGVSSLALPTGPTPDQTTTMQDPTTTSSN